MNTIQPFELPAQAGCAAAGREGNVPSMKILVIEDDLEAAAYLTKAFREAGIVVDHASDGESGLFMGSENTYDVMIIDRMLPRRDGLSVISELRRKGIHTPVLILSALGQVDDRVTGLRAGGDDYLPKPYAFSELLARVEVLGRSKTWFTAWATSNSTGSPMRCAAPARRSCCSRANSACSNI